MSERIIENIKSELTRQHISFAEYRAALNITDEALTELESKNQADYKLVFDMPLRRCMQTVKLSCRMNLQHSNTTHKHWKAF